MALIECPECGRQVSDKASSCPQCGCPIHKVAVREEVPAPQAEHQLFSEHPAMFRGDPGRTLFIMALVVLCVLAISGVFDSALGEDGADLARGLGVFGLVLILLYLLVWWLQCMAARITITTHRTTVRRGILAKKTTEVRHVDVRLVQVEQSILQRIFRSGTLAVGSAGHAGMEIQFRALRNPERVAAMIRERQQS